MYKHGSLNDVVIIVRGVCGKESYSLLESSFVKWPKAILTPNLIIDSSLCDTVIGQRPVKNCTDWKMMYLDFSPRRSTFLVPLFQGDAIGLV